MGVVSSLWAVEAEVERRGPLRILCFGDGLTAGLCEEGDRFTSYGSTLKDALLRVGVKCDISICGFGGHTAQQLKEDINKDEVKDNCGRCGKGLGRILRDDGPRDLVMVMAGTNDLRAGAPMETVLNDLVALHSTCHSRGIPTIAFVPPITSSAHRECMARMLSQWVQHCTGVLAFIDPEELVPRTANNCWEADSVHLSAEGSHMLGQQLVPRILPVLSHLGARSARRAMKEMVLQQQRAGVSDRAADAGA